MKTFLHVISMFLPAFFTLAASANTLYKCVDNSGVVLYTNQKASQRECSVLSHQPSVSVPGITGYGNTYASNGSTKPRASASPTPGDFPRVSGNEQKARDGDRRAILDKELQTEEQNLEKARKMLLEVGNQSPERLQAPRDTVALHERNVYALKKELANVR